MILKTLAPPAGVTTERHQLLMWRKMVPNGTMFVDLVMKHYLVVDLNRHTLDHEYFECKTLAMLCYWLGLHPNEAAVIIASSGDARKIIMNKYRLSDEALGLYNISFLEPFFNEGATIEHDY